MKSGVLYISYDGMLEPLGQSQVLAYLCQLAKGRRIHLISFEKPTDLGRQQELESIQVRMAEAQIVWHPLRYHKSPTVLATAWDVLRGFVLGFWLVFRHDLGLVHARSYVAGVMAMWIKSCTTCSFLFDMRGYWVDERVDGGLWPKAGVLYRAGKWFERRLLRSADHVISLTNAAVADMSGFVYLQDKKPGFTVIPTCADLDVFSPNSSLMPSTPFVLGYVGSAGTWYLFDEVAQCFALLRQIRPDSRLLVINRGEHEFIREKLAQAKVPISSYEVLESSHRHMPVHMAQMHAGVFFIRPAYSKTASAPTKLAELLGCGLPCLCNEGVGDMGQIVRVEEVGVTLTAFDEQTLKRGLTQLLQLVAEPGIRERCVATAKRLFSLDEGVARYSAVYDKLLAENNS